MIVINIDKSNPQMLDYYNSLTPNIKEKISRFNANVSTVGELMLIVEHLNQEQEELDEFKQQ